MGIMGYYDEYVVALWKPHYNAETKKDSVIQEFLNAADKMERFKTPDETYIILRYYDLHMNWSAFEAFEEWLESHRHAAFGTTETALMEDIETEDAEGCDEEFEYLLRWHHEIEVAR